MANDLLGRLIAEAKRTYTEPVRMDNVLHACPECPIGSPKAFCPTCLGMGNVTEGDLARWVRMRNAQ
jgi:hypothetical protein